MDEQKLAEIRLIKLPQSCFPSVQPFPSVFFCCRQPSHKGISQRRRRHDERQQLNRFGHFTPGGPGGKQAGFVFNEPVV